MRMQGDRSPARKRAGGAWPNHVYHASARNWFRTHHESGWATCPTTENAFIRVSSNGRIISEARSPLESTLFLRNLTSLKGHVFWSEENSIPLMPEGVKGEKVVWVIS